VIFVTFAYEPALSSYVLDFVLPVDCMSGALMAGRKSGYFAMLFV
jgi:hypothetical protein